MTIDDFEWVQKGFDEYALIHKKRELTIAAVKNFNGWYIHALKLPNGVEKLAENIDNLEAAKVIAMLYVNQNMEGYPNANNYSKRAIPARTKKIPKGVFRMDKLRR